MVRKSNSLGRTVRSLRESGKISDNGVLSVENRPLNEDEKAVIAKRAEEQAARLARIAERAKKD